MICHINALVIGCVEKRKRSAQETAYRQRNRHEVEIGDRINGHDEGNLKLRKARLAIV